MKKFLFIIECKLSEEDMESSLSGSQPIGYQIPFEGKISANPNKKAAGKIYNVFSERVVEAGGKLKKGARLFFTEGPEAVREKVLPDGGVLSEAETKLAKVLKKLLRKGLRLFRNIK